MNTNEIKPWNNINLLRVVVRTLNAHHVKTSAGFYGLNSRFFKARSVGGTLEVSDFENWVKVSEDAAFFHDHNGRKINFPR